MHSAVLTLDTALESTFLSFLNYILETRFWFASIKEQE